MRFSSLIKIIINLFFLCIGYFCTAQYSNIKIISSKNGLNGTNITSIIQDSKGFFWIGTEEGGLSRFDGKKFIHYTKKNGLPGNLVKSICEDKNGNIWFSLDELGAAKFDGKKFDFYTTKNGLADNKVNSIYADSKNNIWFCTNGGLTQYDGTDFHYITTLDGLANNRVFCMTEDHKGNYWFGTSKGLCKYDEKTIKIFTKEDGLSDNAVYCLQKDSKENIWIGTIYGGVNIYKDNSLRPFKISPEVDVSFVIDICEDSHNNIWISTDAGGLVKYAQKKFARLTDLNGLSSNFIPTMCTDYEGKLWIGTLGGGVNILNDEALVYYEESSGLFSNNIFTIKKNSFDELAVFTEKGINLLQNGQLIKLDSIKELATLIVISACYDNKGDLWLGTRGEGLFQLELKNGKYVFKKSFDELSGIKLKSPVSKVISANNNEIIVATYGDGVFIINSDSTFNLNSKNHLPSNNILSLYQDKAGTIWIGTFQNGLVKYDGKTFVTYTTENGLAGNTVQTIAEDSKGNLYFGSDEDGISILSNGKFTSINSKNGLSSDNITSLYFDNYGYLWVGTNKGANRVAFDSNFVIKSTKYFGEQKGLKSLEISNDGIIQDKEGLVWICTAEGLVRYNPKQDYINNAPPKLILNNIQLAYQNLDTIKLGLHINSKTGLPINLSLPHNKTQLTFFYQALSVDAVKYSYILEGQDNDWSPLTTDNYVTFSNVSPGKYIFKVKAINADGFESDKIIEYAFTVNPPWYKTWWFYTLCALTIIGGTISFTQLKTKQLKKQKQKLEEKVTERTVELKKTNDSLSVALTDISDSINYAKRIQNAILPVTQEFKQLLPNSFILFKPRNIVSGDFYWFLDKKEKLFVAAVDCTGHGVPGAFMSMIGTSLLNEIVKQDGTLNAAEVLDCLNVQLRIALKQDRETFESKDGMDLSICVIDKKTLAIDFAGAKRPIYLAKKVNHNYELQQVKGDRYSIGGMEIDKNFHFSNHLFQLNKGDRFYLFSDGFADQFGGEHGKKLTTKRFEQHLTAIQSKPIVSHHDELNQLLANWQGDHEQVDDILVIGIEV